MVTSLVGQGFPPEDVENAVHAVVERIQRDPSSFADKLADLDDHKSWFLGLAFDSYRTLLHGERQRRRREIEGWLSRVEAGVIPPGLPDPRTVLSLAAAARVTHRQRSCLEAVLVKGMVIDDIAELNGISPRAVRLLLQRGASRVRRHLRHQARA